MSSNIKFQDFPLTTGWLYKHLRLGLDAIKLEEIFVGSDTTIEFGGIVYEIRRSCYPSGGVFKYNTMTFINPLLSTTDSLHSQSYVRISCRGEDPTTDYVTNNIRWWESVNPNVINSDHE